MNEGKQAIPGSVDRFKPALLAAGSRALAFVPLILSTLLFAFGVFLAWQAWLVWRTDHGMEQADRMRTVAVEAVAAAVRRETQRSEEALGDPAVQQALAAGDLAAAGAALRARLPEANDARFFSPDLDEVLSGDLAALGYAKAAALMQAKINPERPLAEMRVEQGVGQQLMIALPAPVDGKVRAFAVVEWPFAPIRASFARTPLEDVRLELRQGDGRGDLVIAGAGRGQGSTLIDSGVPVPGTRFRIGKAEPDYFIIVPPSVPLVGALALLCLLGGALALWLRHVGLDGALERLRRRKDSSDVEMTLSQTLNQAPAGTPAVSPPAVAAAPVPPVEDIVDVDPAIFRMYDIRGVVGTSLTPGVARLIGRAIGSEARERDLREIVVGRDGRLSGPEMVSALIAGLRSTGIDVIDIGAVPTPLTYFACYHLRTGSGISVTGSHNPPDYNGFKIVLGGETLSEGAIHDLYRRIAENRFVDGMGGLQAIDVGADYLRRISDDIQVERPLKVVVDCGNGIPGAFTPALLEAIGCEVEPLYCEVDGTFPNHHPDPSEPENLKDLILAVQKTGADIGLAFDGDGDRLGVVTAAGEVIFPDRLLMLFAMDILTRNPGATIIYDVKCTGHLQPLILQHGGSPLMWRTGHSLIKAKMRETEAALAGEMSGHFFFGERWYGFDDGLYSAARLLEILAADPEERTPQEIFDTLPKGVSTPELKVPMAEGEHYRFIEAFRAAATFEGARLTTIDGVRADWPDGWGLVRASNTTPVLVLRFDADDAATLARIQEVFRNQLLALDPGLALPF
ncbi:MAG: phosphomannomutase/phosphoglucomutase [Xanthomonadales bacterium]|nr:phosphomannomutase/phosphoglucomutase [Xanthomonadales bacterium]